MRPAYHFTPKANWLSDPNGLVHDGSVWHMFYQYNPQGEDWGNMSWGHCISHDLAHWQELDPAILADDRRHVFSGSAIIDHRNSAGFGNDAMIALYTAAATGDPQHQAQALAYSGDSGESWTDYAANPVLDLAMADFRDPYVFWHAPSAAWVMVVVKSNEQLAQLYRSSDLKSWELASEIPTGSAPGEIWECPTLVELPVGTGAATRWLLKVDVLKGAPGSGAIYLTGGFDGHVFRPDSPTWQAVDHGRDFYAAIAWNGPRDAAGRPAWIGWMGNHAYQHALPKRGWRGVMSLPRRLSLVDQGDGLKLAQAVEPSVADLFGNPSALVSKGMPAASRIVIGGIFSGEFAIGDGANSHFSIRSEGDQWRITRSDAGLPFLDAQTTIERTDGLGLAIWVDRETIEVMSMDGTTCASFQHRPAGALLRVETDQAEMISVATLA